MSVRRAPCAVRRPQSAVRDFLSGAFLVNRMTYLHDIWYVNVARAEFSAWHMLIKYLIAYLCKKLSRAFLGNRMPHLADIWYVGRARAEGALSELHGGQRSSEVK